MSDERSIPNAATALKQWENGQFACSNCGKLQSLEGMPHLQLAPCPSCKNMLFVPKKISNYFLYEPTGSGGMGSVYKAVSPAFPEEILAVKILARAARENPADIHALLNEARVSSYFVESQFVAACLDNGFADDEYFAVMPFIQGERLDQRIERLHALPEKEVLTIGLHLLAAEQHIYRTGYLFRDLKPENIIIQSNGYAILLDFGLCISRQAATHNEEEFISGSPYYLPPERLLGQGEDASSEIYSLGMVLYHALTGKTFFDANEMQALVRRHISGLRVNSSSKMEGLRPSIGTLLDTMVRQKKEERPQDFGAVATSIQAILQEING